MKLNRIFFLFYFALAPLNFVHAETLTVHDLAFPVDALTALDPQSTQVTIGNEVKVVAPARVAEHVVSYYFLAPEPRAVFTEGQVEDFVEKSIAASDITSAAAGMQWFCRQGQAGAVVSSETVLRWCKNSTGEAAIRRLLLALQESPGTNDNGPMIVRLVALLAAQDLEWVRSNAISLVYAHRADFIDVVQTMIVLSFEKPEILRKENVTALMQGMLNQGDADAHGLWETQQILEGIAESARSFRFPEYMGQLEALRRRPNDISLQNAAFKHIEAAASRHIQSKEYDVALLMLAGAGMAQKNPRTQELFGEALRGVNAANISLPREAAVQEMMRAAAAKDAGIRATIESMYERDVQAGIVSGNEAKIQDALHQLLMVRPDPSPANDELRLEHIYLLLRKGMRFAARDALDEVKTSISLFAWLRLFYAGIFIDRTTLLLLHLIFLFSLGYAGAVRFRVRREQPFAAQPPPRSRGPRQPQPGIEDDPEASRAFVEPNLAAQKHYDPETAEYAVCLDVLGLKAGTDKKAIKTAYRRAVKKYHPDFQKNQTPEASEKFIEITKAYERAMELFDILTTRGRGLH